MPRKAAFCSQCGHYVWLTDEGLCENGHSRPNLRDVREVDVLPAVAAGAASMSTPPSRTEPAPSPWETPAASPWESQVPGPAVPAGPPAVEPTLLPPATDLYASSVAGSAGYPIADPVHAEIAAVGDPFLYAAMTQVQPAQTDVFGKRVGAFLIDTVILQVVQVIAGVALGIALAIVTMGRISESAAGFIGYLFALVIYLGYFTLFEVTLGFTPGKGIFGLRVVTIDKDRISFGQALGRNAARFIDLLFFALPGILAIRGSSHHQRLGDQWAGTYVIGR